MTRDETPALRIVRGVPTAEELAAVAAVIAGSDASSPARSAAPSASRWSDPAFAHRRSLRVGPGGWRAAGG